MHSFEFAFSDVCRHRVGIVQHWCVSMRIVC